MLGWALKKGFQGATGRNDASGAGAGEDTTQFEAPDTPAPVFAARAFKNAIFGTSNTSEATATTEQKQKSKSVNPTNNKKDEAIPTTTSSTINQSPAKPPNGILLTPGTGTARRKRVSFNHDVKAGGGVDSSPLASARQRKRSTLQRALENSRSAKSGKPSEKAEEQPPSKAEPEDEWEDDVCDDDVTVDLNEPHSESGKYWKAEFNRYRDEAMADIERMVKFKALAKSYAKKKDAESLELAQKLREAELKVAEQEEKMAAMSAQIPDLKRRDNGKEDTALAKDLAKQANLTSFYRDQVKELAALVKEYQGESSSNHADRRHIDTSPRTEKTLLEVNRELRRARSELNQMDKLREENKKLKSNLSAVEARNEDYKQRVAVDLIQVKKLELKLKLATEESQRKDEEIRQLKKSYETLKRDAKSRTAEAMQVLQQKNDRIAELEKTIKALETANPSGKATGDLRLNIESLSKPSRFDETNPSRTRRRAASVEDMTLDMTQRSLLASKVEPPKENILKQIKPEAFLPSDWSDSYKDIKSQLRSAKKEQMEANKRERDSIMADDDTDAPRSALRSGRAMSNVHSSRLNRSPTKIGPTAKEYLNQKLEEARAAQEANAVEMHGALENPTSRALRPRPYSSRPLSSGSEAPGFDLVQDRFARLGGPEPERTSSGNTSRCTLPAERQAAARARLEQRRRERQKNGSSRLRDKENIKP